MGSFSYDTGLVLCGGGAKGAYQIGVFDTLSRSSERTRITGVSGTSVGALNTVLYVYLSVRESANVWRGITQSDFSYVDLKNFSLANKLISRFSIDSVEHDQKTLATPFSLAPAIVVGNVMTQGLLGSGITYLMNTGGVFSQERLREILANNIDFENAHRLDVDIFSTVTGRDGVCYKDWRYLYNREIPDVVLASSSLPIFYPKGRLRGRSFRDGGLTDNVPIKPLYDMGYRRFIVVYLDNESNEKISKEISKEDRTFPDAEIIRIIPRREMHDDLVETLTIDRSKTEQLIEWGREDSARVLV